MQAVDPNQDMAEDNRLPGFSIDLYRYSLCAVFVPF